MVTISDESVQAIASSLDRSSRLNQNSSVLPTPENVFIGSLEEEIPLQIEGSVIPLDPRILAQRRENQARAQANSDCRRYAKLFKQHVVEKNTGYSVVATRTTITVNFNRGGNSEVKGTFPYKVGVVKALYMLVSLCNWNMDNFLKNIEDDNFTPFADSEYTTQVTPTPHEDCQGKYFKFVDGHWK